MGKNAQLPCVRCKIQRNTDFQRSCSVTYAVVPYRSEQNSSKHRHTVCDVFSLRSTHCATCLEGVRRQRNNGKTTGIVVQRRSGIFNVLSDICPRTKDKKTKLICNKCNNFVCEEHSTANGCATNARSKT